MPRNDFRVMVSQNTEPAIWGLQMLPDVALISTACESLTRDAGIDFRVRVLQS